MYNNLRILLLKNVFLVLIFLSLPGITQSQCILGQDSICANTTVQFLSGYIDMPDNDVISWKWNVLPDPLKAVKLRTNRDTIDLKFIQAGTLILHLQMETEMGGLINCFDTITVLDNQEFEILMTKQARCLGNDISHGVICLDDYSTFKATEHVTHVHYWLYKNQGIGSGSESDPVYFNTSGLDTITLISTNITNGCTNSKDFIIDVKNKPSAQIEFPMDSLMTDTFCAKQRLRFFNKSINTENILYQWEVRNISNNQLLYTLSTTNPSDALNYQFIESGDYVIRLLATNECGCSSFDERNLHILEGVAITIECPSVVCSDSTREVTYTADTSCTTYSWEVEGGTIVYQNHNIIRVIWSQSPPSGFGYIRLTTTGCSGDVCEGLTVVKVPILNAYSDITGPRYLCSDNGLEVYSVPSWPGASYEWTIDPDDNPNLQIQSGENSPQVIVALSGYSGSFTLNINVDHPLADCAFEKSIEVSSAALIISPDSVCAGTSTLFQVSGIIGSYDSIRWFIGVSYAGTGIGTNQLTLGGNLLVGTGLREIKATVFFNDGLSCTVSKLVFLRAKPGNASLNGNFVFCPGDTIEYSINTPFPMTYEDTVLIVIQNGTIVSRVKVNSRQERFRILWNSGNGSISYQTRRGQCLGDLLLKDIFDLSEIDSVMISGNQMPCVDSEEIYIQNLGHTPKNPVWKVDTALGNILIHSKLQVSIFWKDLDHDTTTYVIYSDTVCGVLRLDTLPIMLMKRINPVFNLDRVCAEDTFELTISVENASSYTWYLGDDKVITNVPKIRHRFDVEGIYSVGVVWGNTPLCYEGFSKFDKLTVDRNVTPSIVAYDDETGEYFNCIDSGEYKEIRFDAITYNIPNIKYRWSLNNQSIPDSNNSIILKYPDDITEIPSIVRLYVEGDLCTEIASYEIEFCVEPPHGPPCPSPDTINYFGVEHLDCTLRSLEAEVLPDFDSLVTGFVSFPHPKFGTIVTIPAKGLWTINGIKDVSRPVEKRADLIQTHQYLGAGRWLARLFLFGRDLNFPNDSTKICTLRASTFVEVPFTGEFTVDFNCYQDSLYQMDLYAVLTHLQNFEPLNVRYSINGSNHPISSGDTSLIVSAGQKIQVCIISEMQDSTSCTYCDSISIPNRLIAPEISLSDTLCNNSLIQFDIEDLAFSDEIVAYTWDFGNGAYSNQRSPSFNYGNTSGSITVKLKVSNKWGCEAESSKTIYLIANLMEGELTVSKDFCQNMADIISLHNNTGTAPYTYNWNTGDTTSSISIKTSGIYQVTLSDFYGCTDILKENLELLPVLHKELSSPDQLCEGDGNFVISFGGYPEYQYILKEFELPSGSDTIIQVSQNRFNYTAQITKSGKSGNYRYTLFVFDQRDSLLTTPCDSFNKLIAFNPTEELMLQDSLLNCKPYTHVLSESGGLIGAWYYRSEKGQNIYLKTSDSLFVNSGGIYILGPATESACANSDTIIVPAQILLDLFLYGCYDICDTVINKGNVFLPKIYPDRIYKDWAYKHIDGRILKSGSNSSIDSMKLTIDHEGKMYIVAEDDQGCIDSSDLLCLKILECVPPIDCDTIPGVSCPHLSFNRIYLDCDSMRVHYSIYEDMVVPSGWSLCSGIPISIQGAYWIEPPSIVQDTVNLHLYRIRGGILSFHVDSCENAQQISIRICKDNLVCIKTFAWYFPCFEGECSLPSIFIYQNESTSTIRINAKGEFYDLMNCDTSYHYIKAELYGPSCTGLIASTIIANPGVNEEYNINFYFNQTYARDCYCIKYFLCENSNGTNCEEVCIINPCTGYNQDMRTGGDGDTELNVTCAGTQPGSGDNIYDYEGTYSGSVDGAYLDSIIIQNHGSAIQSINVDTNGINGSFILAPSVDSISYHIFILNDTYPNVLIIVGASDALPSCLHDPTTSRTQADRNISMDIRPNPANQFINIDYSLGKICNTGTIKVSNENGKEQIYTVRINQQGTITLPTVHWPSGSYMISIENCSGQLITKRLIVSH